MMRRKALFGGAAALALIGGGIGWWRERRADRLPPGRAPVSAEAFAAAHQPLPAPTGPLVTYHLGHSLVGRDMPKILAQFAGHGFASQLGWGASLRNHWRGPEAVNGFSAENAHGDFRPAHEALSSGQYDAVVFTEMVELRDAIQWHGSPHYLAQWANLARSANPAARLYLYETWHPLDTSDGWETRITRDLSSLWEAELLRGAMAWGAPPLSLIPGGQVMLAAVRAAEAGGIPGVESRAAFFAVSPEGKPDQIHPSPLGSYLMALTHYAVLYQRSPEGLPGRVVLVDNPPLDLPPELAAALQRLVWKVVSSVARTGISA